MSSGKVRSQWVLGMFIFAGLACLGYLLGGSLIKFKEFERSVSVKGLAEREVPADIVLWPIQFVHAENDLDKLYLELESKTAAILTFLTDKGFPAAEVSVSAPAITDKLAQSYGNNAGVELRYSAVQTVTVYSSQIALVRKAIRDMVTLGKKGVVLSGNDYGKRTEYIYTHLNDIKPEMIEEATRNAREVAQRFAADSDSQLGKIKSARQGQFTIRDRDSNNPHIKKVRVVSTVEYYLSD